MALGERLFLNATVLTVDPDRPRATAVGVVGDRIGFIGDTGGARAWARAGAEEIDLGGACLVPGFVEAHNHMISFGLGLAEVEVRPEAAPSLAALVAAVAERARQTPLGRWVLARGYDDDQLTERRHPTRADLDAATSEHPVLVVNGSAHMSVANSLALQLGGVTSGTSDPQGGHIVHDEAGEPTGLLQETAQALVGRLVPEPTVADMVEALARCHERYLRAGITSSHSAHVTTSSEIAAHQIAAGDARTPLRTTLMIGRSLLPDLLALGLRTGFGDDRLRIGPMKFFADGSLIGRTAAVSTPFAGDPGNLGLEMMPRDELNEVIRLAHDGGFQIATHAIGDRGIEIVLDAYEAALAKAPRVDHRHRIEHCGILRPDLIERLANGRFFAVSQPIFLTEYGDGFIRHLGRERIGLTYPFRSLLAAGVELVFSSDCPVSTFEPLKGIQAAVTEVTGSGQAYAPAEAIEVEEALRCYTLAGARAGFAEDRFGSIEVGKLADFAVLGQEPTTVPPDQLAAVPVLATIIGGETVFTA